MPKLHFHIALLNPFLTSLAFVPCAANLLAARESSPGHLMHGHRHTHHMSGCCAPPLVAVHGPGRVASEGPQNEGMALHAPRSKLSSSLVEAKDLKSCRSFEFPGGVPDIQLVCS